MDRQKMVGGIGLQRYRDPVDHVTMSYHTGATLTSVWLLAMALPSELSTQPSHCFPASQL